MHPLSRATALVALASLACGPKTLPTVPTIPVSAVQLSSDEWRDVENVFVVTDASGSMYMAETFPQAKALSLSFVRALPDKSARAKNPSQYNVGAIGFGGDSRVAKPLSEFDRAAVASTLQRVEIMGAIDGRGGHTPVHAILTEVAEQLKGRTGRAAVVIFSDGEPNDVDWALTAAKNLISGHPDGVCFHGVQTGSNLEGAQFLRTLAELSSPCGSFRSASSVSGSDSLSSFARGVMVGGAGAAAPAVAAARCQDTIRQRGIEFGFDRYEVNPAGVAVLDVAAEQLSACPGARIEVAGHTDDIGPTDYNERLSLRRAKSVRDYLVGAGIDAQRLGVAGYGYAEPIASNDTREGRAHNRRVEISPLP